MMWQLQLWIFRVLRLISDLSLCCNALSSI